MATIVVGGLSFFGLRDFYGWGENNVISGSARLHLQFVAIFLEDSLLPTAISTRTYFM